MELADRRFDDTRFLGNSLALLARTCRCGDLMVSKHG